MLEPNEENPPQELISELAEVNSDPSLDAAIAWLKSGKLTEEERGSLSKDLASNEAKLTAFTHVLANSRAARLVQNQGWLGAVMETILHPPAHLVTNPHYWLQVGQLLRQLQEDDTKYLQSLAKQSATNELDAARRLTAGSKEGPSQEAMDALGKTPPHTREKLRRFIEMLEGTDKSSK